MKRALLGLLAALLLPALACAQTLIPGSLTGGGTVSGPLTLTCGTVTANAPCLDATQTWNNAGVAFYGFRLNVTDTNSAAGSLLMDLQTGGSSKFSVSKAGSLVVSGATSLGSSGGANVNVNNNAVTNILSLNLGASNDVALNRDAANTLALRNGTNAQTFNVYNTYTDASNYERGFADWSSNAGNFTIGTSALGTGTNRQLVFATAGLARWFVSTAGHLEAWSDNTYDIGASGANRPRNVYVAGSVVAGSQVFTGTTVVGSLPTCNAGELAARFFVTDATVAASGNFGTAVAGSGANKVPVYCDGTSWKIG